MKLVPKNWESFQHYKDRCPPWVKLHKTLLDDKTFQRLPVASRALAPMLWLLASESKDGFFDGSIDELVFRLRQTEKEIAAGLEALIEKGFFIQMQGASESLAESKQVAVPEAETEAYKTEKKTTSASPSGFAEFWTAYPKKKSKGAAEKVWKRIKPDLQTVLSAIERAKTSADWLKEQGQYIPHPATWLNAKGWEDEIVTAVASADGSSKPWFLSSTGIQSKAESLGLSMQDGEVFPYFKQRVYQAAGVTPEMLRAAQSDFGARA